MDSGIFVIIQLILHFKGGVWMVNTNKTSLLGKIIVIFSSIMAIVMVSGKWLNLYQIPMIFGNSIPHEYSLFQISDFMDTFNMYLENGTVSFYSILLSVGAVAVIVLSAITIIMIIINNSLKNATTVMLMIVSVVLAGVFIGTIIHINAEMKEATYGGIDELLRGTSKPYWLVAFSVLNIIGVRLKSKAQPSITAVNKKDFKYNCTGCGAEIPYGVTFCTHCGKKVNQIQNMNNEKFCIACGAKIPSDMAFCISCGTKVETD